MERKNRCIEVSLESITMALSLPHLISEKYLNQLQWDSLFPIQFLENKNPRLSRNDAREE